MAVTEHRNGARLACDHGLRRQAIEASLLTEIFQGKLRAGQHLVTQDLAERFGVSHTPIREALIAVAGLGVVDLQPNRGAIVRRVTARDVWEVCQVRRVLECEATRLATRRIEANVLAELIGGLRRQLGPWPPFESQSAAECSRRIQEARALDSLLHDTIATSSGNAFLAHELSRLQTLFRALRDASWCHDEELHDLHRIDTEAREHLSIVEAIEAGSAAAAARAMSRHILAGARYWGRVIQENARLSAPSPPSRPTTRARVGRGENRR